MGSIAMGVQLTCADTILRPKDVAATGSNFFPEQQRALDTTECVQTAKHLLMCKIVADAEPMRSRETRKQTGVNYTYSRSLHPSSSSL